MASLAHGTQDPLQLLHRSLPNFSKSDVGLARKRTDYISVVACLLTK
jgi:hypothetical protein